jgi:hypothetical protein
VVGLQTDLLKALLSKEGSIHNLPYANHPAMYLFALNTYIALLAKLVSACALPNASQDILDQSVPVKDRIASLESGEMFEHAGILNMLSGDFFSWYHDDPSWSKFKQPIERLIVRLSGISFDVTKKSPNSIRDIFKGIYQTFVPGALRHALGEFYTPDWLAEHALDTLNWAPKDDLLDPTCGSGTFILEALRRRLTNGHKRNAVSLLEGLYGVDLNPLAVLSAKGSIAVFIAPYIDINNPIRLPIYLADAINPTNRTSDGCYEHTIHTELGQRDFKVPEKLIHHIDFFKIFSRIRVLVDAQRKPTEIIEALKAEFVDVEADLDEWGVLLGTVNVLSELHDKGWNGIWCPIIADRFAAGAIPRVDFICGNPPWVKWSHLPPEYASFIKSRCMAIGVFSSDKWVGGIESDISTVVTYEAIDKYLGPNGILGFFINGVIFTNESSEGFRQFSLHEGKLTCAVRLVEDYTAIKPFDNVSNSPTFLVIQRDRKTLFPIPYRIWSAQNAAGRRMRRFENAEAFRQQATQKNVLAQPVPGGNGARPWLIGTQEEHKVFAKVFGLPNPAYIARKGVTTDRNGIFWVRLLKSISKAIVQIENASDIGRTKGIPKKRGLIEKEHLFPLLRGREVRAFSAVPHNELRILLPQSGMHGDPDLPMHSPGTFRFLNSFKNILINRSSYKRF